VKVSELAMDSSTALCIIKKAKGSNRGEGKGGDLHQLWTGEEYVGCESMGSESSSTAA